MLKKGFNVPDGFVIFSNVVDEYLALNQVNFAECAEDEIRTAQQFPEGLEDEINTHLRVMCRNNSVLIDLESWKHCSVCSSLLWSF
jgi:phosphoenolpyruvate synthase/pyruvate phosphate dikinase